MKRRVQNLSGFTIGATDGEIGKVKEFYFDDQTWTIRYLIVETGSWLVGRKVLISPQVVLTPDWDQEILPVNLTKEQVKNSPDIDTEKPVSRQQELQLFEHYGWPDYWPGTLGAGSLWAGGIGVTGMMMQNTIPLEDAVRNEKSHQDDRSNYDPHLRSTEKVTGYNIEATDGRIGEVEDFIINDSTWQIEYIIVDTGKWFPGKKVIISPKWIKEIRWDTSTVIINASVEHVKNSPEYQPDQQISDSYEANLQNYYGRFISH